MKLIDQIRRQPVFIAFGRSSADSGFVNVELNAVRDASTVTMTAADGSIAPIPGADATNAGVLTAADKVKLDSLTLDLANRGLAAIATVKPAVTHLRTAGYAATGDGGGALYRRVATQPTHALKVQSADGAWWELVPENGRINVRQAGARGDNVTNDGQAFVNCLRFAQLNQVGGWYISTFGVDVPPGTYYLGATTLEPKARVHIRGQSSGLASGRTCQLRWDANVTGIIIHRYNTIGATTEGTPTTAADGSIVEGLDLVSGGGSIAAITDGTKGHGIWLRARAVLRGVTIDGFAGDGIHINATAGATPPFEGNANNWQIDSAQILNCHRSGVFVIGADVNVGVGTAIDASNNGRWGIHDSSFLGCSWISCHTATNGVAQVGENGVAKSSYVHFGGNRYQANAGATEATLAATQPGADENAWIKTETGGEHPNIPTWTSGQPAGTYFVGGAFRSDNPNARSLFLGCYYETGQSGPQFVSPTNVIGGSMDGTRGNAMGVVGRRLYGQMDIENHLAFAPTRNMTLTLNPVPETLAALYVAGDHPGGVGMMSWDNGTGHVVIGKHANVGWRQPIRVTTDLNTRTYGRAATADVGPGQVAFERGIWLGTDGNARHQTNGTAAPTAGAWARGDVVWNMSPSAGGSVGWVCVASGSPGTWKSFGTIAA